MRDVAGVSNQISVGGVYLKLCWENRTEKVGLKTTMVPRMAQLLRMREPSIGRKWTREPSIGQSRDFAHAQ